LTDAKKGGIIITF